MLKSMTGFGEASSNENSFTLTIEVKSLNGRFLKIGSKIAEEVAFVQNELENCIRSSLVRGSVFFALRFTPTSFANLYTFDAEVLKKYLATLTDFCQQMGLQKEFEVKDLLLLPGVVRSEESLQLGKQDVLPLALKTMSSALDQLLQMRAREGAHLEEELRKRAALLWELIEKLKAEAPCAIEEFRQKLEERVNLLLNQKGVALAAQEVLKEVALLAERSDITEETARFESHLQQFVGSLSTEQAVGRKLEFIVQEMVRESNTMGSKASNSALSQIIVNIKAEVDRLKEQVMNVE